MIWPPLIILALLLLAGAFWPLWRKFPTLTHHQKAIAIVLPAAILAVSLALYTQLGEPRIPAKLAEDAARLSELESRIIAKTQEVEATPQNPAMLADLGALLMDARRYTEAANAFRKATVLSSGQANYMILYGEALTLENGGIVGEPAREAFEMSLLADPGNPHARFFLATEKMQTGDTAAARSMFSALITDLAADDPLKTMVTRNLEMLDK